MIEKLSGQTGLQDRDIWIDTVEERFWESLPERVKAPYSKLCMSGSGILSTAGHGKPRRNPGRPRSKAKYGIRPIAQKYREGKAKRTPARGVKENLKPWTRNRSEPRRRLRRAVTACLL